MSSAAEGKAKLSAYSMASPASVTFAGRPTIAFNRSVGGSFFDVLKVQPVLGRSIRREDDNVAAVPVAMLSYRFFEKFFSSDPGVIGQPLGINNVAYEIIGVLPESFYGLAPGDAAQVYSPLWKSSEFAKPRDGMIATDNPRSWVLQVLARRAEGASRSLLAAFACIGIRSKLAD